MEGLYGGASPMLCPRIPLHSSTPPTPLSLAAVHVSGSPWSGSSEKRFRARARAGDGCTVSSGPELLLVVYMAFQSPDSVTFRLGRGLMRALLLARGEGLASTAAAPPALGQRRWRDLSLATTRTSSTPLERAGLLSPPSKQLLLVKWRAGERMLPSSEALIMASNSEMRCIAACTRCCISTYSKLRRDAVSCLAWAWPWRRSLSLIRLMASWTSQGVAPSSSPKSPLNRQISSRLKSCGSTPLREISNASS
mmetsp:Transcript_6850/g.18397  ORF Transcript_6850/g.18397 Transcript_6850/m.18397 type:complete len:252 (+) Transcript_6850:639-1394(+)